MRKSVWLLLVLAWFGLRGRPVQAADNLLFENVTWGPSTPGFAFAPPREVWAEKGQGGDFAIGYASSLTPKLAFAVLGNITIIRDEAGALELTKVNNSGNVQLFRVLASTIGDQHYRVQVTVAEMLYEFPLTVHVIDKLPADLKLNLAGQFLLDYLPLQAFLVDGQGRKYLAKLTRTTAKSVLLQPTVVVPTWQANSKLANETMTLAWGEHNQNSGSFTIVHQPPPISYTPGQGLTLTVPMSLSQPQEDGHVTWALQKPVAQTVAFFTQSLTINVPVTFTAAQVSQSQTVVLSFGFGRSTITYPASPLQPITPLVATPLFAGSVSLQTLATQAVRLPALWPELPIQATGSWQLTLTVSSDLPVPYYLELGPAFANQQVTPSTTAQLAGRDNQMLALSEAALVILPTTRLLAGRYAVTIHFLLVRGPSFFQ
ncbi:hypothetical protein [Lacticaseibacillus suibinensis]|uniref:hypothetical protein n=1 Tax=Lacticaseibacillus suibinensis TaxID=2486011 RepID=UPI0019404753|nr:hypothetical protein [Lacticaseibacillus suibinensis]